MKLNECRLEATGVKIAVNESSRIACVHEVTYSPYLVSYSRVA
jgi:hypothetical protein